MADYEIIDLPKGWPDSLSTHLRGLYEDARRHPLDSHVLADSFEVFSLLVKMGFQNITYKSQFRPVDRALFWISHEHATQIGRVLEPSIRSLVIELTTEEENSFSIMADSVRQNVTIKKLAVSHMTADEVTVKEALGLARLVTKLETEVFTLWAAEYLDNALDAFYRKLVELGNRWLKDAFIGDTSKPDKEDRIIFKLLDDFLMKNRKGEDKKP